MTDYLEAQGDTVRARLLYALKIDLLGPESPEEVLSQSPATRYLVGMLAPRGTTLSASEDEGLTSTNDGDDEHETGPRTAQELAPSSVGLSFIADLKCDVLSVRATWGTYERAERNDAPLIDPEEAADIDPDDDPEATASTKYKEYDWVRNPFETTTEISLGQRTGRVEVSENVLIEWLIESVGNGRVVSVFLVNARTSPDDRRPPAEDWLYQPEISVTGDGPIFLPRRLPRDNADTDPDIASADLIYRRRREFAVGHGIAAGWDQEPGDETRAIRVHTTIIPDREVRTVRGPDNVPDLSMDRLGRAESPAQMIAELEPLLDAYAKWVRQNRAIAGEIPSPDDKVARDHINAQAKSLERMRAGLECLKELPAFEAFRFANRAMALQRRTTRRVLARRRNEDVQTDAQIPASWRPFQIGFMLQALTSLVHPSHPDRDVADLLWYPTGGGKTEAYLGLTAFTFALRRLQTGDGRYDYGAGTAVLMRYTLRLLTIQQFQRALTLVCACETIRSEEEEKWGKERFTIGLWVGRSVTPNTYRDSKEALENLRNGQPVYDMSPYQVLYCPWCGEDIPVEHYVADDEMERTLIKCPASDCHFGARNSEFGLPALLVDQEIYRNPPSLVLATVDKFAQMAWNGRIRALFGRVDQRCPRHGYIVEGESHAKNHRETAASPAARVETLKLPLAPPDLIIQDELHLISGPLGSLVGIYEAVIDGMSTRIAEDGRVRPKIVASTATVRRAQTQIRALFDRDADIFPALGIDVSDSFFAVEEEDEPGRLYVGVFGPGKSIKTILVRTYGALLSRAQFEFEQAFAADPNGQEVDVADAYMTLVGYFNSLRELGGALRLLDDDVPARLRVLHRRAFGPNRTLYEKDKELTSRRTSSEISETLKALDRTFKTRETGSYPIDVLLASNMISVGVDIDRLGLMVVSAQPKTSAEYIQATSRVGRTYPGLIVEVYNWVRPRDISHYERFGHYHDTFYRHVEATSVTPFSERARDRALRGVLASFVRQDVPGMALPEKAAAHFDKTSDRVGEIVAHLSARAYNVTRNDYVVEEMSLLLDNLTDEWHKWAQVGDKLVYSRYGLPAGATGTHHTDAAFVLMRAMEQTAGLGAWPVATSLREVEEEIDVVLLQDVED